MKNTSVSLDSDIPIPEFSLPSTQGGKKIGTADFRQRSNVVLFFFSGPHSAQCQRTLKVLRDNLEMFDWLEASVVAIANCPLKDLMQLSAETGPEIIMLADEDGKMTGEFMSDGGDASSPFLVVADRFGSFFSRLELEADEDIDLTEVESTLLFIATQCPECGRPDRDIIP